MPVRVTQWPDRTTQASGGDAGQTASALEGITLQSGDGTVPAPSAGGAYLGTGGIFSWTRTGPGWNSCSGDSIHEGGQVKT